MRKKIQTRNIEKPVRTRFHLTHDYGIATAVSTHTLATTELFGGFGALILPSKPNLDPWKNIVSRRQVYLWVVVPQKRANKRVQRAFPIDSVMARGVCFLRSDRVYPFLVVAHSYITCV